MAEHRRRHRRAAVGARESCGATRPAVAPPANRRRVPVVALLALGAAFGAVVFGPLRPGRSLPACRRCASRFPRRRPTNRRWRCRPMVRRSPSSPIASGRRCSGCARSTAPRAGCSRALKAPAIRSGRPMGARSASSPTTSSSGSMSPAASRSRSRTWRTAGAARGMPRGRSSSRRWRRSNHARVLARRCRAARDRARAALVRIIAFRSSCPTASASSSRRRSGRRRRTASSSHHSTGRRRSASCHAGRWPLRAALDAARRRTGRAAGLSIRPRCRKGRGRAGNRRAGLHERRVQLGVLRVRYRRPGVSHRKCATASTGLGQSRG